MAEAAIIKRDRRLGIAVREPNPKLVREVEALVEEAERAQGKGQADTTHWFYSVPQAGVRYYSF